MITDTKSLTGERALKTDILAVLMIYEMLLLQRIDGYTPSTGVTNLSLSGRSTPADRSCGIFAPTSTLP